MGKIRTLINKENNHKIEFYSDYDTCGRETVHYCIFIQSEPGQKEVILDFYNWRKEGTKIILF